MSFEEIIRQEVRAAIRDALPELRAALAAAAPGSSSAAPADGYLSVEQAADLAGVCTNTIRAWIKAGRLPRRLAGRELRVRRDELHGLLAAAEDPSAQTPGQIAAAILAGTSRRR